MAVIYPEKTADDILEMALNFAAAHDDETLRSSQQATVRRRVRDARKKLSDQDDRWSLAGNPDLLDRLVPPSARRDVLDVSVWHAIGGTLFSFRNAKWVARLRGSFPRDDAGGYSYFLANSAARYANQEKISEVLGKNFESSALDLELAMRQRSQRSALRVAEFETLFKSNYSRSWSDDYFGLWSAAPDDHAFSIVLDLLASNVFNFCPKVFEDGEVTFMVQDRRLFEMVVLALRKEGAGEFLKSTYDEKMAIVHHLYELASHTVLKYEEARRNVTPDNERTLPVRRLTVKPLQYKDSDGKVH